MLKEEEVEKIKAMTEEEFVAYIGGMTEEEASEYASLRISLLHPPRPMRDMLEKILVVALLPVLLPMCLVWMTWEEMKLYVRRITC